MTVADHPLLFDARIVSQRASVMLEAHAYRFGSERALHDGMASVLSEGGIEYEREFRLDARNRADFWIPCAHGGVVVEVKVHGSLATALAQVFRYANVERVQAVVLASTCRWGDAPLAQHAIESTPLVLCRLHRACL